MKFLTWLRNLLFVPKWEADIIRAQRAERQRQRDRASHSCSRATF